MTNPTKSRLHDSWKQKSSQASAAEADDDVDDERAASLYDRAATYADRLSDNARDEGEADDWLNIADEQRQKARHLRGEGPAPTDASEATDTDADSEFTPPEPDDDEPIGELFERPPTDGGFGNVIGQTDLLQTLQEEVILPLRHPHHFDRLGVSIEQGVLLDGPPGNGKSLIGKMLAAEADFPVAMISPSKVTSRWVGEASKNIDQLYENAKANAEEHGGAVVLLDEIDSLAPDRAEGRNTTNAEYQMLTELLTTLEEVNNTDHNVVTVATTNVRGELDTALTRSGRFNKEYTVTPPEPQTRIDLLEHYLTEIPDTTAWPVDYFDRTEFIARTDDYVARDVEEIVIVACRRAAVESTRRNQAVDPQWTHITEAIDEIGDGTLADWNDTPPTKNTNENGEYPDPQTLNDLVGD